MLGASHFGIEDWIESWVLVDILGSLLPASGKSIRVLDWGRWICWSGQSPGFKAAGLTALSEMKVSKVSVID